MRVFGDIPGVNPSDEFENREALAKVGVYPPTVAVIGASQHKGAGSIVLTEDYQDDEAFGGVIIYPAEGRRIKKQ